MRIRNSNKNDEQSSQQQQQDQNDQQGEDENQQDSESEQEGDQQDSTDQNQQSGEPNPDEMTREDAERLLNALNNKEEDLLKDFHKNQVPQNQRHAKDW